MATVMEMKIDKEQMQECFEIAMKNIEIQSGLTLQECVEKQVPKKPKMNARHFGRCACCNTPSQISTPYCCKCGQKLDWSESNGEEQ